MFVHAEIRNASSADATPIAVQFNPTSYDITRNQTYASTAIPGLQRPLLQYIGGQSEVLSLELLLDDSERARGSSHQSVGERLEQLREFVTIDSELHAPPVVQFHWAETTFTGVVSEYQEKFSLFNEEGEIERARVTLKLTRYDPAVQQDRREDRHSPDRTKTRTVRAGERLDTIAAQEYGDPTLWPAIARANGLSRPRILTPGMLLVVPPLD